MATCEFTRRSRVVSTILLTRVALLVIVGMISGSGALVWNKKLPTARTSFGQLHENGIRERLVSWRGGSTLVIEDEDLEGEEAIVDPEEEKKRLALRKWRMDQQNLMQLRSFFLGEILAKRGIPIATLMDVSTAEGDKPPENVDWDCAMSTEEEPKPCLYSFDAEPNTKVVSPIGIDQWISLSSLNRLRRTDPTKVEPMWHSQYAVLESWFGDDSEFSMLQHVGFQGFLTTVLLDSGKGMVLRATLILSILTIIVMFMPVIEFFTNRMLVSGIFWSKWSTWGRIMHAALPLKLLIGQFVWKLMARSFTKLETKVRDYIVDIECDILEQSLPLTVGPGSEDPMFVEVEDSDPIPGDDEEYEDDDYDSDDW